MNTFTDLSSIGFRAILDKGEVSSYEILRMACYPLTKQTGDKVYKVQLWLNINGELTDIIEQNQFGIEDITKMDIGLIEYYLHLQGFEEDEMEEAEECLSNPKLVDVHVVIKYQEI